MKPKQLGFELPELDRKKTQAAVEAALEKYRIYKYLSFQRREASMTASYSDMPRSNTGVTSDQTGSIATYNVDEPERRRLYCEGLEQAVQQLPRIERAIIELRYMDKESDYVTDQMIYQGKLAEHLDDNRLIMSFQRFDTIRWRAFTKLADWLGVKEYKSGSEYED